MKITKLKNRIIKEAIVEATYKLIEGLKYNEKIIKKIIG